jgi:hypothetical protein
MQIDAEKSLAPSEMKGSALSEPKASERYLPADAPANVNTPIVDQAIIRVTSGDIVSLSGVTSASTGCYQILVSAEVLPQDAAAK